MIPGSVTSGEDIKLDYEVDNTGSSEGEQTINFLVEGSNVDKEENVKIESGNTFTGSFTYSTSSSDKPKVEIQITSDDKSIERNVDVVDSDSQIQDWYDLDNMRNDLDKKYVLVNDLDENTNGYNDVAAPSANGGKGFEPIGDSIDEFTGSLDGNGYVVDGLYIDCSSTNDVGLIGYSEGSVTNIGVTNVDITGAYGTGGLVGENYYGTVLKSSYATGTVSGTDDVGGLDVRVGGLDVRVGGLVGRNDEGSVTSSYATGTVSGTDDVGGLVGYNDNGDVTDSYWDEDSSGMSSSAGGTGLNTSEMTGSSAEANMNSLDFSSTWETVPSEYLVLKNLDKQTQIDNR